MTTEKKVQLTLEIEEGLMATIRREADKMPRNVDAPSMSMEDACAFFLAYGVGAWLSHEPVRRKQLESWEKTLYGERAVN